MPQPLKVNEMKTIEIGCLVMLIVNTNLKKELANKTRTFIWFINLDFQGQVNYITFTINHSRKSLKLKRCTTQYKYTFNMKFAKLTFLKAKAHAMI
jgi:hypothetical protein